MAVYTDVVAEDLAAFLAGYGIGELLAYKGIAEGVENSNFLVHTSRGNFILTLYERRVAALAQLHLAGLDFAGRRANALSVEGWRALYEQCGARANEVQRDLKELLAAELTHLEKLWPHDLPEGVIHADLFPDNVFFLGDRLSGLIDFYFACTDALAYDVAICLNAWCFETDHSYNVTKGRNLLQAYAAVRPLAARERQALPLLARGAALRFLLTRLVDWFDLPPGALVRPKDPVEYYRKLRFHQAVKSVRDYGIEG